MRDHRKIGAEMELFAFSPNVGVGLPLWLPKGTALRDRIERFLRQVQDGRGYQQVITPHIANKTLYVTSGHYARFGRSSFQTIHTSEEGEEYLLKPMNCPHHCEIFKAVPRSYRELPLRLAEYGNVYRYEQSGQVNGMLRTRGFTQDDAHTFCTADQVVDEVVGIIDSITYVLRAMGMGDYELRISLRDTMDSDKYIGTAESWAMSERAIIDACRARGLNPPCVVGESTFYGPKLDFLVHDSLGRPWQLGTIQVDYNLPERFQLEYTGSDNQKHRPVMVHHTMLGSFERFIAILLEHTDGWFPLWLAPIQVSVLPVSEKYNDYAYDVQRGLAEHGLRVVVDDRNVSVGKKIRDNECQKIAYLLVVGEKEAEKREVSVRKKGENSAGSIKITNFAKNLAQEVKKYY